MNDRSIRLHWGRFGKFSALICIAILQAAVLDGVAPWRVGVANGLVIVGWWIFESNYKRGKSK